MKKTVKNIVALMFTFGTLILLWFIFNNIQSIKPILVACFILAIFIFSKVFSPKFTTKLLKFIDNIFKKKHLEISLILASLIFAVVIRLSFFFIFTYSPVSDPSSFLNGAEAVASGVGLTGNKFVAFFPYLFAYDNLLGQSMNIFSNPWLATIILNTVFDIASAIIIYIFIKKVSEKSSKAPLLAFILWLFSPLNIIFSVLSLPIIVVNFFIILAIFITYLLIKKIIQLNTKWTVLLSILLGLTVGFGNCFRPIFSIIIIALMLTLLFEILKTKIDRKKLAINVLSSFLIVLAIFLGINVINIALVSSQTGYKAPTNSSGWSIFVGANYENSGGWNIKDDEYFYEKLNTNNDLQAVHNDFAKEGVDRYKNYGFLKSVDLFIKKLAHFSSNQGSVYDAEASIVGYQNSKIALSFSVYIIIFTIFIFITAGYYLFETAKNIVSNNKYRPIILFILLTIIGFFVSETLVESQIRYAQIMYPAFIILSTLFVDSFSKRQLNK